MARENSFSSKNNLPAILVYLPVTFLIGIKNTNSFRNFSVDNLCIALSKILGDKFNGYSCLVMDGSTQSVKIVNAFLLEEVPEIDYANSLTQYPLLNRAVNDFLLKLFADMRNESREILTVFQNISSESDIAQEWRNKKSFQQTQAGCDLLNELCKSFLLDGEFFHPEKNNEGNSDIVLYDHYWHEICRFKLSLAGGVAIDNNAILEIISAIANIIHEGELAGKSYFNNLLNNGTQFNRTSPRKIQNQEISQISLYEINAHTNALFELNQLTGNIIIGDINNVVLNRFCFGFNLNLFRCINKHISQFN